MRLQGNSPTRDIFRKTAAFITALRKVGCGAPVHEFTDISTERREAVEHQKKLQQGYKPQEQTCAGQILFEYDMNRKPFIRSVTCI
jgi:hypothetical protein